MQESNYELPHSSERIVGVDLEAEKETIRRIQESTARKATERIEKYEIDKTGRDIALIRFAEEAVARYSERHRHPDSVKEEPIPLERVHVLREGGTEAYLGRPIGVGAYDRTYDRILVDRSRSDLWFVRAVFHELFHMKGTRALQVTVPDKQGVQQLREYRNGFIVETRDAGKEFFVDVEEALTSIMERRFVDEMVPNAPLLEQQVEETAQTTFTREREVREFRRILDRLFTENREQFATPDAILDLFLETRLTGRFLKVARLVERTFGTRSFRMLAQGTERLGSEEPPSAQK